MVSRAVSVGALSLLVALVAWKYRPQPSELLRISIISAGLTALETSDLEGGRPRVAVAYGACYDLFAEALPLLDYNALDGEPAHFDTITSMSELLKSFAYYFQHGAAAEYVHVYDL